MELRSFHSIAEAFALEPSWITLSWTQLSHFTIILCLRRTCRFNVSSSMVANAPGTHERKFTLFLRTKYILKNMHDLSTNCVIKGNLLWWALLTTGLSKWLLYNHISKLHDRLNMISEVSNKGNTLHNVKILDSESCIIGFFLNGSKTRVIHIFNTFWLWPEILPSCQAVWFLSLEEGWLHPVFSPIPRPPIPLPLIGFVILGALFLFPNTQPVSCDLHTCTQLKCQNPEFAPISLESPRNWARLKIQNQRHPRQLIS